MRTRARPPPRPTAILMMEPKKVSCPEVVSTEVEIQPMAVSIWLGSEHDPWGVTKTACTGETAMSENMIRKMGVITLLILDFMDK